MKLAIAVVFVVAIGCSSDGGPGTTIRQVDIAACTADYSSVQTAQQAYYAEHSTYAPNVAALVGRDLRTAPSGRGYTITTDPSGQVYVQVGANAKTANPIGCRGA